MICLPTIMHTGTNTLMHMLDVWFRGEDLGQKYRGVRPFAESLEENEVYVGHCIPWQEWENLLADYPVATTLRHPARVFESYMIRTGEIEKYIVQWDYLIDVIDKHAPVYVIVDDEETRDASLRKAAALFGAEPKSEWKVLGSSAGTYDMDITDEMMDRVPEKYINFYMEQLEKCRLS